MLSQQCQYSTHSHGIQEMLFDQYSAFRNPSRHGWPVPHLSRAFTQSIWEKYGGLLGDISFPPRQQVLCVQGYWTLQTIYYPECLRCGFELQMPSSAGKLLVRQRRATVVLQSQENDFRQCCWESAAVAVMWLYSLQKICCEYDV